MRRRWALLGIFLACVLVLAVLSRPALEGFQLQNEPDLPIPRSMCPRLTEMLQTYQPRLKEYTEKGMTMSLKDTQGIVDRLTKQILDLDCVNYVPPRDASDTPLTDAVAGLPETTAAAIQEAKETGTAPPPAAPA
jgi:hypothetical protein